MNPIVGLVDAFELGYQLGRDVENGRAALRDGRDASRWCMIDGIPAPIRDALIKKSGEIHWMPRDKAIVTIKQTIRAVLANKD